MTPKHPKPNIETAFRDYRSNDGIYFDLIGEESFISTAEFEQLDHHFKGNFDDFGQFIGDITVYNQEFEDCKIVWAGNNFKRTMCGSFSIECAYLQGDYKQSFLDPILHTQLRSKLERYGGLYIYRDGIRILPYGDNNFDFLDIERNRTKSASYYFFSYRRMMGVVNITKQTNYNLVEKAGREGFIENKAYRQIRDILKNFFLQLANDFFREKGSGASTDVFLTLRKEREKMYKAKEEREKRAKERKTIFLNNLNSFFNDAQSGKIKNEINNLLEDTNKGMSSVASIGDNDEASQILIDFEFQARKRLSGLRLSYKVTPPRSFSISKDQRRNWEAYTEEYDKINNTIFLDAEHRLEELVDNYTKELHLEISKRKRIEKHLEFISDEAKDSTKKKYDEARNIADEVSTRVRKLTQELMSDLEQTIRKTKLELPNLKLFENDDIDIFEDIKKIEAPIIEEREYTKKLFGNYKRDRKKGIGY